MTIPSKELVGKNPKLVNGAYIDDYMIALNEFATVNEVLGKHREAIADGNFHPTARVVMGTLDRFEYENHLAALIMVAAKTGEWRAVERGTLQKCGLEVVTERHFGYVVEHDGETFLLPSAKYLAHCKAELE